LGKFIFRKKNFSGGGSFRRKRIFIYALSLPAKDGILTMGEWGLISHDSEKSGREWDSLL
jgi:hypothetical protein